MKTDPLHAMYIGDIRDERQERLNELKTINERVKREGRSTFTDEEREQVRLGKARVEYLDDMVRELNYLDKPIDYSGMTPLGSSAAERPTRNRHGKQYADLFGPADRSPWKTFESYLSVVHSGLHHPDLQSLTMGGSSPAGGGWLVPAEFAARMLDKSLESEIVRPRCQVEPMMSDTKKIAGFDSSDNSAGALFGGFTATWAAEADTATDKDAKIRQITLKSGKLYIFTRCSNELIADGLTFEEMLGEALVQSLSWHLDFACLQGTGAGQPRGILSDPALVTVSKESGQPAATILYENIAKMFARLHPGCVGNSVWIANNTTIPQLLRLSIAVGTGGSVVPALTESNGEFRMLTRPCIFTEKLPALGTVGDIILADLSQYSIGLRKEISLEKSIHVGWQNDTSGYRSILRADGQGRWSSALTPRHGDSLSWCVALATRS